MAACPRFRRRRTFSRFGRSRLLLRTGAHRRKTGGKKRKKKNGTSRRKMAFHRVSVVNSAATRGLG
ncbi:hypothetical protein Y88_3588 [Novosphingobium nitrogenifigens DSM 19370]|uniref:Uncharacterized protein n=1 Tax=Novosphingobium nitrogenifigens DSM 19370 TaxID=983920 RepID=F1ZDH9_9SPHN|nr:hypothetical protein Y88_3588 [Novosphingobium nitrogenifigens DSM 19370]